MLTKNFFIDLHGCAKNQVDAEILNGILIKEGWRRVDNPSDAILIIINSCGFIEEAKKESINSIVELRSRNPSAKIVLAGCLAERYADVFANDMEELDGVFGNGKLSELPHLLNKIFKESSNATIVSASYKNKSENLRQKKPLIKMPQVGISCGERPEIFNFSGSVYIKITEGCNNCCSFCAIPIIRGALRSRKIEDIIAEIQSLINRGVYEFNLVGQDLGVFAREENIELLPSPLSLLLTEISKLEGRFVVRLLYIHPDHFPLDILPIIASDARFLPYFDIPFQSGSDKIIRNMNRCGSAKKYLDLLEKIRKALASSYYNTAVIRTTFLVGFPGETDENFDETLKFLKMAKCLWSGVFAYSKEDDTPSFSMKSHVKNKIKHNRKRILEEAQTLITNETLQRFVGEVFLILVEELIEGDEEKLLIGRAWFQAPDVDGVVVSSYEEENMSVDGRKIGEGELVWVQISRVSAFDLVGKVVKKVRELS